MGPYRLLGKPKDCEFITYTPKQSVAALLSGRVIAAPVPVGALPALNGVVEFIGNYGIAAEKAVGSVLLFSRYPFEKLKSPKKIYLTHQSASSCTLLYLLLNAQHNINELPTFTTYKSGADAMLLIGDQALMKASDHDWPYVIDLVTQWYKLTQLPFVFARWVVRKEIPQGIKNKLTSWLDILIERDSEFIDTSAPIEAKRLGIKPEKMNSYLRGMKRVLSERELSGQNLFLTQIEKIVGRKTIEQFLKKGDFNQKQDLLKNNRVTQAEALEMLKNWPLNKLMKKAYEKRQLLFPDNLVTFVKDTNPNYTNICETKCSFCAFRRDKGDKDAYTLTPEKLALKIKKTEEQGATTVLLQGGNNPDITLKDWLAYIQAIKKICPKIHIHPFSPPEIYFMAKKEKIPYVEILTMLFKEGINTMPGGGGELLVDNIRNQLSPHKCPADEWLNIMVQAHNIGFRTTATLMYGHIESDEDIVNHLFKLRDIQDTTGGFSSFIPWSFKPGNSPLSESVSSAAHPAYYVRIIAVARLVLDNFDHIQSSWFSENDEAGHLGLLAGADDFGGILIEENVLANSGYKKQTSLDKVKAIIKGCGFIPALRDSYYKILDIYE